MYSLSKTCDRSYDFSKDINFLIQDSSCSLPTFIENINANEDTVKWFLDKLTPKETIKLVNLSKCEFEDM